MNHPDIENQEQEQDTNTEIEFYENKDIDNTDDIDADTIIDDATPIQWVYQSSCWVERVSAEEIESGEDRKTQCIQCLKITGCFGLVISIPLIVLMVTYK
jgi:hypothetical protein